jgi:hypothetical protein
LNNVFNVQYFCIQRDGSQPFASLFPPEGTKKEADTGEKHEQRAGIGAPRPRRSVVPNPPQLRRLYAMYSINYNGHGTNLRKNGPLIADCHKSVKHPA